jgi:DNA adenine methylase
MKVIVPPIKSQGIKTKLVPWIMSLLPDNVKGKWLEPFFGTGVVAFNSGFKSAILSDTNPHIINFYQSIKEGKITPSIARSYLEFEGENLRQAERNGYEHFNYIKHRFNENHSPLDFLFLSRAGFNGMMRFNKSGGWNIPFCQKPDRFNKSYITKIVNQIDFVSQIVNDEWIFLNKSFEEIILMATKYDIIYCDPPYTGRYVDYYNGWNEQQEENLFKLLSNTPAKFILSTWHHNDYRENLMVEKFWKQFNIVTRDHFYHSGGKIENRRSIVEALVFNFDSNLLKHNHGIKTKAEQFVLLENRENYLTK